ncbi:hypothetical protein AAMO2058_001258100 [Amorphochlora amoebiformis]
MWVISECFRMKPNVGTYGQLCETALGYTGRVIGGINIILLEVLVGAGYLVFVGFNIASVAGRGVQEALVMLACVPIIGAFIFSKDVASLGFISSLGNFAIVASLTIIMGYAYLNTEGNGTYELYGDLGGLAVFLGSTVFMFSGHAEVIAIVKPMKQRSEYPKVLLLSVGTLFLIYAVFGIGVYLSFGEITDGLIFNNMSGFTVSVTKVFHSLAILFSIPVKLWPAFEALEVNILGENWQDNPEKCTKAWSASMRLFILFATSFVAIAIPDFAFLVAFCGSFCISLVGLVLPPLIYIILSSSQKNLSQRLTIPSLILHWILFIIGVTVCTASSGHILYMKLSYM